MSFKDVVWQALAYLFIFKRQLTQALLIPFIISMTLDIVTEVVVDSKVLLGSTTLLTLIIQTIIAITTHRIILIGPNSIPKWGNFNWSKRETLFTLYVVGLCFMLLPFTLFQFIPAVGGLISLVLYAWFVSRFSLVFPGIAVDQGVTFKLSWTLTKDRQLMMFLVVIILPALTLIPSVLLKFLAIFLSSSVLPYTIPITSFLSTFATVFTVVALSVSYKLIYADTYKN